MFVLKKNYFETPQVCFVGLAELENNCWVVEECACSLETLFVIFDSCYPYGLSTPLDSFTILYNGLKVDGRIMANLIGLHFQRGRSLLDTNT